MKLVYFGYDPLADCLPIFLQHGYQFAAIYTGQQSSYSQKVIQFAEQNNIELCFQKPSVDHMQHWIGKGVELFFSAEYPWKIPMPASLKYALNVHPTLLPEGRGKTPLPLLILRYPQHAGVTLHKLDKQLDGGDIVVQQPIKIALDESFDTLSAKVNQHTQDLLNTVLPDLKDYYKQAKPQGSGSEWSTISPAQQTLDWQKSTHVLLKQLSAFGSLGCYAVIAEKKAVITAAHGQTHKQQHKAGKIVTENQTHLTVATGDGQLTIAKTCLFWL